MTHHRSSIWLVSVALAGCTATTLAPLDPDHPASPLAAEAPVRAPTTPSVGPEPRSDAAYTCPMHPEIRRSQPGRCPLCGMDLVTRGGHAH
jgi:hypothetical protein